MPFDIRNKWFSRQLKGHPSVKDTIESLRVPHPEVGCIVINGRSRDFSQQLQDGDRIAVYPDAQRIKIFPLINLIPKPLKTPRFVLDSHLGKLACHLRLLGFNTIYRTDFPDEEIVTIIKKVKRILLTRDIGLLKNKVVKSGHWIRSTDPLEQIKEVLKRYGLGSKIKPFTLCLECNGKIVRVDKARVSRILPPKVKKFYTRFYRCSNCHKVYWQGSHYERLLELVNQLH